MEVDATRALELLVGLPDVVFLGVDDEPDVELLVHVECRGARVFCDSCGIASRLKERPVIALIDLPCYGRRTRLIWHKRRFSCPDGGCSARS